MNATAAKLTVVYVAGPGSGLTDEQAHTIGEFCERVKAKRGTLTPETFVRESRSDMSVRRFLDWDNESAAHRWRLKQAALLIGSFTVRVEKRTREVNVRSVEMLEPSTRTRGRRDVAQATSASAEMVRAAKRDLIAWSKRYAAVRLAPALAKAFAAIEGLES